MSLAKNNLDKGMTIKSKVMLAFKEYGKQDLHLYETETDAESAAQSAESASRSAAKEHLNSELMKLIKKYMLR